MDISWWRQYKIDYSHAKAKIDRSVLRFIAEDYPYLILARELIRV